MRSDKKVVTDSVNRTLAGISEPVQISYTSGAFTITDADGETATSQGLNNVNSEAVVNPNTYSITVINGGYACTSPTTLTQQILPSSAEMICGKVVSKVGNLLPYNIATLESGTTLTVAAGQVGNGTIVNDLSHSVSGLASNKITTDANNAYMLMTHLNPGSLPPLIYSNNPSVVHTRTFSFKLDKPQETWNASEWYSAVGVNFYNENTTSYRDTTSQLGVVLLTSSNTDWKTLTLTAPLVRPWADGNATTFLSFFRTTVNKGVPSTVWVDNLGVWEGEGGVWAPPGQPIIQTE